MPTWGENLPEIYTLYLGGATGGTFTLSDGTTTTAAIAFDAAAATIETELEGIYGAGNVTVDADTDFTITFAHSVGEAELEADFTSLTGATDPALTLDQEHQDEIALNVVQDSYAPPAADAGYTEIPVIPSPTNLSPMTILQQGGRGRERVSLECWVGSQAEFDELKQEHYAAVVKNFVGHDGTNFPAIIFSMTPKRRVFEHFIEFSITFMEES